MDTYFTQLYTWPSEVKGHEVRRSNDNFGVKSVPCAHSKLKVLLTPNLVWGCTVLGICASSTLSMIGQRSEVKGQDVQKNNFFFFNLAVNTERKGKWSVTLITVFSWHSKFSFHLRFNKPHHKSHTMTWSDAHLSKLLLLKTWPPLV